MILEVSLMALFLAIGNLVFRHFEPFAPLWRRLLKAAAILAITALISHYFGRSGVIIAFLISLLPVIYIHAVWLPRHGINGWTAEPLEKYHALRGWPPPQFPPKKPYDKGFSKKC